MSLFSELAQVGMEQALEGASQNVIWVFAADATGTRPTENVWALVSEENVVERNVGGNRMLVKTRGLTFSEDASLTLAAVQRPSRKHAFRVWDTGEWVEYAVKEIISRASGGSTVMGERVDRREASREGMYRE